VVAGEEESECGVVVKLMAVKLAVIGVAASMTGAAAVWGAAGDALDGDAAGQFVTVAGGGVTALSMGMILTIVKMFRDGQIISKVSDDREVALAEALTNMTHSLDQSTAAWQSVSESALRREEALASIIGAYLPGGAGNG
jgi:hypothetical protein